MSETDEQSRPRQTEGIAGRRVWTVIAVSTIVTIACVLAIGPLKEAFHSSPEQARGAPRPIRAFGTEFGEKSQAEALRSRQRARLDSFAWHDSTHTSVDLPIDVAMDWFLDAGVADAGKHE